MFCTFDQNLNKQTAAYFRRPSSIRTGQMAPPQPAEFVDNFSSAQCVGASTVMCWILNCALYNVLDPQLLFVRASAQYRSSANMISTLSSSERRSPPSTSAAANGPLTSFVHRRICSGQCPQCARRLQQTTRKHQTARPQTRQWPKINVRRNWT